MEGGASETVRQDLEAALRLLILVLIEAIALALLRRLLPGLKHVHPKDAYAKGQDAAKVLQQRLSKIRRSWLCDHRGLVSSSRSRGLQNEHGDDAKEDFKAEASHRI